ncbi:MAG: 16S rRNA (adenine(1518)-N(6)/adenine(1519)-N(6))-dimethyltransferase RsmA [Syntrophales bacterium]
MISSVKILKKYQVQPRKRLSQSFLRDDNVARKIVLAANLQKADTILEIGAGHGILTRLLAPEARQVIAVDIDPAMIAILEKETEQDQDQAGNVRIILADILKMDIAKLCEELQVQQLKVIGNIPYAISTEILFHLLSQRRMISQTVLMVQREVADRLTGLPGTKAYGVPTVLLSMHARLVKLFDVPPQCFYPRPRVTSSVISLTFRERPRVDLLDEVFFTVIVKAAFASRRKTLWNNLRSAAWLHVEDDNLKAVLSSCGLDDKVRGEALPVEIFGVLSNKLFAAFQSGRNA